MTPASAFPVISAHVRRLTGSGKDIMRDEELAWEDICSQTQVPFVRSPHLHGCPGGRDGASGFPEEHCLWYSRFFKFYKITSWFCFLFL